jgi:acetyltransferase-like isoleucine patch superfamily enzyme
MPRVHVARGASIVIGSNVVIRSASRSNAFSRGLPTVLSAVGRDAILRVGDRARISDTTIVCAQSVDVGADTYLGVDSLLTDTDAHPACPTCREQRRPASTARIVIGAGSFVGARAIVLKGVWLAPGTVVGAGAVVSGDSTELSGVLVGNPARSVHDDAHCTDHGCAREGREE